MNGLTLDVHLEEKAVEMFAQNIMTGAEASSITRWKRHLFQVGTA